MAVGSNNSPGSAGSEISHPFKNRWEISVELRLESTLQKAEAVGYRHFSNMEHSSPHGFVVLYHPEMMTFCWEEMAW